MKDLLSGMVNDSLLSPESNWIYAVLMINSATENACGLEDEIQEGSMIETIQSAGYW